VAKHSVVFGKAPGEEEGRHERGAEESEPLDEACQ